MSLTYEIGLVAALIAAPQGPLISVHIPTSKAVEIAQTIASDEGYDLQNDKQYYFDLLQTPTGKAVVGGFVSIGFYIGGDIRSAISISEQTGQAIDMNSCEVFSYDNVLKFQIEVTKLSNAKVQSPAELAHEVGCDAPIIVTKIIRVKAHE